jgi:hypothetical protein
MGVVFTTTFHGDLYAFNAATGAILLKAFRLLSKPSRRRPADRANS